MKVKSFKKTFSEGWGFLGFTIAFAVIVRVIYYFQFANTFQIEEGAPYGLFWNTIYGFLNSNFLVSVLLSGMSVAILAALVHHINNKHILIRTKTYLPESFIILLFSLRGDFFTMNIHFVGAIVFLLSLSALFSAYNSEKKQRAALNTSFLVSFFSLFDIGLLIYLPVLWLSLITMRSLNFKAFLGTLFGLFVIYTPVFSIYLLLDRIDFFLEPIYTLGDDGFITLPVLNFDIIKIVALTGSFLLIAIIFINNYVDSFKDKVRVRAYNLVLAILFVVSIVFYLLIDVDSRSYEYISIALSAIILAHFYALVEVKWKVVLFYLQMIGLFTYFLFELQLIK